jgi:hypothetical protein
MRSIVRRIAGFTTLAVFIGLTAGCGSSGKVETTKEEIHIRQIGMLAGQYKNKHKRLPQTVEELKKWAQTLKPEDLQKLGIDNLESAFISPRDGQPYAIATSSNPMQAKMGIQEVLFYEKEGVKGKHLTVSSMGSTSEMDRDRLKNTVPNFGQ